MANETMDIKILSLYKLHIPKTKSFSQLIDNTDDSREAHRYYVTMGHYDLIDIADIKDMDSEYPDIHKLFGAHKFEQKMRVENKKISKTDFSSQNMLVFVNLSSQKYGFSRETIDKFWNNKEDHKKVLFVSMLHININNDGRSLEDILEIIKNKYKNAEGLSYLYYFTLDYSDIIIFCKTNSVKKYINFINTLNYDFDPKIIRDSFSLYGICRSFLVEEINKLDAQWKNKENDLEAYKEFILKYISEDLVGRFYLKINIGVQNYNVLNSFRKNIFELDDMNITYINQIGRNDFSLINESATLSWLIYIEFLIDKYTTVKENGIDGINDVFSTFEAFVGINAEDTFKDDTSSLGDNFINTNRLKELCMNFKNAINNSRLEKNASNYYNPIFEVLNSINSITKNRFANDFIVCMFESFYRFVEYMTEKISAIDEMSNGDYLMYKNFDDAFNNYFMGLTSLVNSAMHTDRSFIQATAFNAILFDVPPKLMSFYTAVVYELINIMKDEDKFNYSFIFTPNFSEEITANIISYPTIIPEDRILSISINEPFFYNPPFVISTVAHEIAHICGDFKRNRRERFENFIKCTAASVLDECLPDYEGFDFDQDFITLINDISAEIVEYFDSSGINNKNTLMLLQAHKSIIDIILMLMYSSRKIDNLVSEYIKGRCENVKINDIRPIYDKTKFLFNIYRVKISRLNQGKSETSNENIRNLLSDVISVYSETFSDMQMILILDLSFQEYMAKLKIYGDKINEQLKKSAHKNRFSVIIKLMISIGVWSCDEVDSYNFQSKELIKDSIREMNLYLEKDVSISDEVNEVKKLYYEFCESVNGSEPFNNLETDSSDESAPKSYYCMQEYSYLIRAAKASINCYLRKEAGVSHKIERIKHIREIYKCIRDFEDINEVSKTIRSETESYMKTLSKLN